MTRILVIAAGFAITGWSGDCFTVDREKILGSDLKSATPNFAATPDSAVIAYAPVPGARRTLTIRELAKYGSANAPICFERSGRMLTIDAIENAMRAAYASRRIEIDIVDYLKTPVPEGVLEFPLSGLTHPSLNNATDVVVWRGRLQFDTHKTLSVWASVRLREDQEWVEATEALLPGKAVLSTQVQTRSGPRFPAAKPTKPDLSLYIGRIPRRSIAALQELSPAWFSDPPLVSTGETVQVEAVSGAVSIQFDARAQANGRLHDSIVVLDPQLGRRMKGDVSAKGKVIIYAQQPKRGDSGAIPDASARPGTQPNQEINQRRPVAP